MSAHECFNCERSYITSDNHPYCSQECQNELQSMLIAEKDAAILAGILDSEGNAILHPGNKITPETITKIVEGFKINLTPSTKEPTC